MLEIISSVQAADIEQIGNNPMEWGFFLWIMILALTLPGGIANWIARTSSFNWMWSWRGVFELLKDVAWSSSIGPLAFMLVIRQTDDLIYAMIANGIAAHLAPRLIFGGNALVEMGTNKYLKKIDPTAKQHQLTDDELNQLINNAVNKALLDNAPVEKSNE